MVIKMKKVFKVTIVLIVLAIGVSLVNSNVYAALVIDERGVERNRPRGSTGKDEKVEITDPNSYKPGSPESSPDFDNKVGVILGVIRSVGVLVSVGALIVIGIKEMVGSVEEKSNIKKAMPGYIVGVILVLAMTTLPSIIYNLVQDWS